MPDQKGKKLADALFGQPEDKAAFGVFPQMKPRRSQRSDVDPNVAIPRGLARGFVSGAAGAGGDLEQLARLLANTPGPQIYGESTASMMPGQYRTGEVGMETRLPTSEDIEKRLPFRQEKPSAMEGVATGAGQIAGGFYTGPGAPIRAVTAIPEAIGKAGRDFVRASGQSVSPLTVWHGSSHKFPPTERNPLGEFDSSKIGTGEGAQSYGQGSYLAEAPGVAKTYQPRSPKFEENLLKLYSRAQKQNNHPMMEVLEDAMLHREPQEILEKFSNIEDGYTPEHAKAAKEFAGWYAKNPPEVGGLYKVDLPDEVIAKMIDYDKPLNEQAQNVKDLLERAGINIESSAKAGTIIHGQESHLAKHGIPGVKYLDDASRQSGEGTRNFVVFPGEEKALTILERNTGDYKKGGKVSFTDNPDTMRLELMKAKG